MSSQQWFLMLMAALVAERIVELVITRRHLRSLLARGGKVVAEDHYGRMVVMHTTFLIACPLEVWFSGRAFLPWLGYPMLVLLVLTMALRYWAIATLGDRWTTRVVVVPGEPRIVGGPYRFLSHPNYLAVVLEVAALPLVHTAWWSALFFSLANAAVLRERIRVEDEALDHAGPDS